jgi:hypothetical protein
MNPKELEAEFKVLEEARGKEHLRAIIAGEATFYFTNVKAALPGLVKTYERIVDAMGAEAKYVLVGVDATRPRKFKADDRGLVAKWAKSAARTGEQAVSVRSGAAPESIGPWSFTLSVTPEMTAEGKKFVAAFAAQTGGTTKDPDASYLSFTAPIGQLLPDASAFRDLVLWVASSLPVRSGHAGLGFSYNSGAPSEERDEQLAAWNKRYHGIDVGSPECSAPFASSHIRGVSWLTLLDDELVKPIGGCKALDALDALDPEITIHTLPHGVAIQAGAAPRLGDVNELEDMTPYIKVNRLLKPIRAEEMYPPSGMDPDEAREWLARFDTP